MPWEVGISVIPVFKDEKTEAQRGATNLPKVTYLVNEEMGIYL